MILLFNRIARRIQLKLILAENANESKSFVERNLEECKAAYTPVEVSDDLLSTIITANGEETSLQELLSNSPKMLNRDNEKEERFVPSPYKIIAKSYQDYLTKLVDTEEVFGSAFKTASAASMEDPGNSEEKEKVKIYTDGLKEINTLAMGVTQEIMDKFQQINELGEN